MKVVRTDRELCLPLVDGALREGGHELVLLPEGVEESALAEALREADLLLMCYTPITAAALAGAQKLRGIIKYGVGIDAIDITAAQARGIPVANIPEYAEETVAEGAFALLLALAKKLQPLGAEMQASGWAWPQPQWLASDIAGKTIGLVGLGRIGRSMARMAGAGFRARVLGYDPNVSATDAAAAGIQKCDELKDMLAQSDFISVHCVLNDSSRGLIGPAQFAAMKPSAYFVNVSRGAIVDETALLAALQSGRLAGAALDVYAQEPLAKTGHPLSALYGLPNVILSPHLTFYTQEAMARLEQETWERCQELLNGQPLLVKSQDPRLTSQRVGVVFP